MENKTVGCIDQHVHQHMETQLLERIMTLSAEMQVRLHDALKALAMSESMSAALWWLGQSESPMSRRELAEVLRFDPSNVTLIADRLEALGYVERAVDSRDRRFKAMQLTEAGRRVRDSLIGAVIEASVFKQLSRAEQTQLNDLLGRALDSEHDWKSEKSKA